MPKDFYLISVNMGLGHQRTAFPLREFSRGGKTICANDYPGIPDNDKRIWETTRRAYEFVSRSKRIPVLGPVLFFMLDQLQKISNFYPKKDLSRPAFQTKQTYSLIERGWGEDLIERLKKDPLPIISTFFIPAFMAETFDYPGEIFCVICDADLSRAWAPYNPKNSRIKYFVPTERAQERLESYGVRQENIFFTGYPLPKELIGGKSMEILKDNLKSRFLNLDPQGRCFYYYSPLVEKYLGELPQNRNHVLTILFSVGGAGAQKEIGIKIIKSLAKAISKKEVKVILSAGIKPDVKNYFENKIRKLDKLVKGRISVFGEGVEVLYRDNIEDYFAAFNEKLNKADILWTKPSELSFYSALGLPIIISPPMGSQEEFNMRWLLKSGFGIKQENPQFAHQWLFAWINKGYLAEAALQGFIEGEKLGTFKIAESV